MRKILLVIAALCICALLVNVQAFPKDTPAICKKLVDKVEGEHHHPEYYTGKHGFMNDEEIMADNGGPLEKNLYIMSWLVLDPPICVVKGGNASIQRDLYKDVFGISEDEVTAAPANWPFAGQRGRVIEERGPCKDYVQWIPINFQDLVDAGQGDLFSSGNEFDWAEWGFRNSFNDFHEYLFCLVRWNNDTTVEFAAGSDDPEQTWINGEKILEGLGDRNWTADTERAKVQVKGGEWVAILAEVGERGGECGYTLKVNPPPDDHTLDTEMAKGPIVLEATNHHYGFLMGEKGFSWDWGFKIKNISPDNIAFTIEATLDNANFSIISPNFPRTLSPLDEIEVIVRYQPTITGVSEGTLTLNALNQPVSRQVSLFAGALLDSEEPRKSLYSRAVAAYDKTKDNNPYSAATHNNLGVIYRLLDELERAEEEFNQALEIDKNFSGAQMNLGVVYTDRVALDAAIEKHNGAKKGSPELLEPQIYYNLGWIYDEMDSLDEALKHYSLAYNHEKANNVLKAKAYVGSGVAHFKQGEVDLARADLEKAIELDRDGEIGMIAKENIAMIDIASNPDWSSNQVQLVPGINLISVPLYDPRISKLNDLSDVLGGKDAVTMIISYDTAAKKFVAFMPTFPVTSPTNATVTGSAGYIVMMKASKSVQFEGLAWSKDVSLAAGINMIAVPVNDPRVSKFSDLVDILGGKDAVTMMISYDTTAKKFVAFMPTFPPESPANVAIAGGTGYIVMMKASKSISFEGEAWKSVPVGAPPVVLSVAQNITATPLLAVDGSVVKEDGSLLNGVRVTVRNLSTGQSGTDSSGVMAGDGRYVVNLVDLLSNRAAKVGDTLEVTALNTANGFDAEPITYMVTAKDIAIGRVTIKSLLMSAIPKRTALLPAYPNPFNPDTWIPYQLHEGTPVTISIYDVSGRLMRTLHFGYQPAGVYASKATAAHWDGRNEAGETVSSGIYFYTLKAGQFTVTRKMVILK